MTGTTGRGHVANLVPDALRPTARKRGDGTAGASRGTPRRRAAAGGSPRRDSASAFPRPARPARAGRSAGGQHLGTLPAAVDAHRADGSTRPVHVSTELDGGEWAVEVRRADGAGADPVATAGEELVLPGGVRLRLRDAYPEPARPRSRLWRAGVAPPVAASAYLLEYGRPIGYSYLAARYPIERLSDGVRPLPRERGDAERGAALHGAATRQAHGQRDHGHAGGVCTQACPARTSTSRRCPSGSPCRR